jgi:hypothetical protein
MTTKTFRGKTANGEIIEAVATLSREGNQRPYFSLTGETWEPRKRDRSGISGAIHDEILAVWPELEPLARLHLSDENGEPMHAIANAIYWAGLSTYGNGRPMSPRDEYGRYPVETDESGLEWSPVMLAKHLRVSEDEARSARAYVVGAFFNPDGAMAFIVRTLGDRWKREAVEALDLIQ